ncbi:MAG: cyclopropane-fatty-acyl-phospholipid synthase family protein [Polyangiales bacterium]
MNEPSSLSVPLSPWAELASELPSRIARSLVMSRLEEISFGKLTLIEDGVSHVFGPGGAGPHATVQMHHPDAWTAIALGGSLGAGETYMDGLWSTDDLVATVRILLRTSTRLSNLDGSGLGLVRSTLEGMYHRIRRNTKDGSRRNIADHYDLGNDFYQLWLDPSMMYSSAMWERDDMTLEEAQQTRLDRICRKLELTRDDHLLEIGTGWGGMAIHAASRTGCRVTTTTISRRQYDLAVERVREAGLDDRVSVLLEDYRDLRGSYDKLVSIEMIEAVGAGYFETYFAQVGGLLSPDGLALIQAITTPDDRFAESVGRMDFIKRYIFPGGQLPSVDAMSTAWRKQTDLRLLHFEDFGDDYGRTLHEWRRRFHARLPEIEALGYPPRFRRMWDFYLASCEGAFLERHCGVAQLLLARPDARRSPLRTPLSA